MKKLYIPGMELEDASHATLYAPSPGEPRDVRMFFVACPVCRGEKVVLRQELLPVSKQFNMEPVRCSFCKGAGTKKLTAEERYGGCRYCGDSYHHNRHVTRILKTQLFFVFAWAVISLLRAFW